MRRSLVQACVFLAASSGAGCYADLAADCASVVCPPDQLCNAGVCEPDGACPELTVYPDLDGDGIGAGEPVVTTECGLPRGFSVDADDCDPEDPEVGRPARSYADSDGDGFGALGGGTSSCTLPAGSVANGTDCDDTMATVHPDAHGLCVYAGVPALTTCAAGGACNSALPDAWVVEGHGRSRLAVVAADLDGDGVVDLAAGVQDEFRGGVLILFGPIHRGQTVLEEEGLLLTGEPDGLPIGSSLASAGDVDGDGADDLLIGSNGYFDPGGTTPATAYLVLSGALRSKKGEPSAPVASLAAAIYEESSPTGNEPELRVHRGGDLDGDGRPDVILGAPGRSGPIPGVPSGAVLVVPGRCHGVAGAPLIVSLAGVPSCDVGGTLAIGASIDGGDAIRQLGEEALVTELDGAAPLDLVVLGAYGGAGFFGPLEGALEFAAAPLEFRDLGGGYRTAAAPGDLTGDSFDDLLLLDPGGAVAALAGPFAPGVLDLSASPTAAWIVRSDGLPLEAVSAPGDLDGDGVADLVLGGHDDPREFTGSVYLVSGATLAGLTPLDAPQLLGEGETAGGFGLTGGEAADFDGDGALDLVLTGASVDFGSQCSIFFGPWRAP